MCVWGGGGVEGLSESVKKEKFDLMNFFFR